MFIDENKTEKGKEISHTSSIIQFFSHLVSQMVSVKDLFTKRMNIYDCWVADPTTKKLADG